MTDGQAQTRRVVKLVPPEHGTYGEGGGDPVTPTFQRVHRRRPPNPAEQARRKAWGREWGAVGHQWKLLHPDERR